jgi:hypothetical protein
MVVVGAYVPGNHGNAGRLLRQQYAYVSLISPQIQRQPTPGRYNHSWFLKIRQEQSSLSTVIWLQHHIYDKGHRLRIASGSIVGTASLFE